MSNNFVPNDPKTFISRGFMTGRPITLAGVRASTKKAGESGRAGMQFFFTEVAKDGERRILSGFLHDGAWGDQMQPSDNLRGLVPVGGADKPFIEKDSSLGLFNAALLQAGCPPKLLTGDYSKLIGMELVLEEKSLPSFKRKKSVDPDDAPAAAAKEFKTEVPSKIITLPVDNAGFVALTAKEITAHLKEREDKRAARNAAAAPDAELDEAVDAIVADATDDEDEAPAPKKAKKAAKKAVVEDDDDEEAEEAPAADSFSDTADDDDDEEADPAPALAEKLILKVLKAEKKVKGSALLQKVHPHLAGTDKKVTAAVLKLVQSPKFIADIEGVSVKGNMVVLG